MLELPLWIFLTLILLIPIALTAGYELGVHRYRGLNQRLSAKYQTLADDLAKIGKKMENDLFRAGIDTGRNYIIDEIEQLITRLRSETT